MVSEQCSRSCSKSETKNEPHLNSSGFQRTTCTTTKAPVLFWSAQNVEYATKRMIKGTSHLSLSVKALLLSRTGCFPYNAIKKSCIASGVPVSTDLRRSEWRIARKTNRMNRNL